MKADSGNRIRPVRHLVLSPVGAYVLKLAGQPVLACPPDSPDRVSAWARAI